MIRDCCLHIGAQRKFKNKVESLTKSPSQDYFEQKYRTNEQASFSETEKKEFGKSSLILKEANEMVFEYEKEKSGSNLAYLSVGDSGVLRVDIKRFFRERLVKDQEGRIIRPI